MLKKLPEILRCPKCYSKLEKELSSLECHKCKASYEIKKGVVHFLNDKTRPEESKRFGEILELEGSNLFIENAVNAEKNYLNRGDEKTIVDNVLSKKGIIVDLCTGPGSSNLSPILKRLSKESLVIATDSCSVVTDNLNKVFAEYTKSNLAILDVDLNKSFPFADNSVDLFTGVGITNVSNMYNVFSEMKRCLKIDGEIIIEDRFYDVNSETSQLLKKNDHLFSSLEFLNNFCDKNGLEISRNIVISQNMGKTNEDDGLPISQKDKWTHNQIYIRKTDSIFNKNCHKKIQQTNTKGDSK